MAHCQTNPAFPAGSSIVKDVFQVIGENINAYNRFEERVPETEKINLRGKF